MAEGSAQHGNYLVMARKWRPATFADVVGQQHIVRSLQNAIQMDRIAGAYLFSGMRGVGKTSMARIFARSINCEKGPTLTPCGECANCREIAAGGSLDVVEIDGASNNGVDEIRDIKDHVQYAPVKCRMKIYIIDEVHMLSTPAFNAFLKTLEEPPPHTVFIMATTEQNKVPETVLSRCQCFEFRAISDAQIAERLKTIAGNEKLRMTDGALLMIARRAEGSMRDAQSLLDQAAAYAGDTIDEATLGVALGLVSREKIWAVLGAVAGRDVDAALGQLHALYYAGFDVGVLIRELFEAVRLLTVIKVSGAPEKILNEPPDSLASARDMVKDVSAGRLQQFYDLLLRAKSQAAVAGNPLSVLEMALIKMVRLDDVVPVSDILEKLRGAGVPPSGAGAHQPVKPFPATTRPSQPAAPTAPPPEVPDAGSRQAREAGPDEPWVMIRSAIAQKRPMLGVALEKIVDFAVQGEKAVLSYPEDQTLLRKQCEESRELIESEIAKNIGKRLVFVLAPATASPKTVQVKKPALDLGARKQMLDDPIIQKAVDLFDGRPGFENDNGN